MIQNHILYTDIRWYVGGSQHEILDLGFILFTAHQQNKPVIMTELIHPVGFNLISSNFTVRDVITKLFNL